jgi:hypothetical protein
MKHIKKILIIWSCLSLFLGLIYTVFPHREANVSSLLNMLLQLLLFLISLFIFISEPTKRYKFLFLNFSIFFATAILQFAYQFIGHSVFINFPYASVFSCQYTQAATYYLQAFAITYLVFDLLFKNYKTYHKYLLTIIIVSGVFLYYFYPFIENSKYIYTTEDIQKYRLVRDAQEKYKIEHLKAPVGEDLAALITLPAMDAGKQIGTLYPEENLKQIKKYLIYLEGDNYLILIWQPLYYNLIYLDVFILLFIFLYFGYQYAKDPPQGAYVDKMMYMFLLIAGLDIFHQYAVIKSIEFRSYWELFSIGQYFTTIIWCLLVVFFYARLRFIKSVVGEFYETELQANPEKISRWIDGIDRFILSHFTSSKDYRTRLFEQKIN